jgi:hypothetical protein
MGRYYYDKKDTVEDSLVLDVFWLKKYGYFCGYKSGGIKWTSGWGRENNISFTVDTMNEHPNIELVYTITDRDTEQKTDS